MSPAGARGGIQRVLDGLVTVVLRALVLTFGLVAGAVVLWFASNVLAPAPAVAASRDVELVAAASPFAASGPPVPQPKGLSLGDSDGGSSSAGSSGDSSGGSSAGKSTGKSAGKSASRSAAKSEGKTSSAKSASKSAGKSAAKSEGKTSSAKSASKSAGKSKSEGKTSSARSARSASRPSSSEAASTSTSSDRSSTRGSGRDASSLAKKILKKATATTGRSSGGDSSDDADGGTWSTKKAVKRATGSGSRSSGEDASSFANRVVEKATASAGDASDEGGAAAVSRTDGDGKGDRSSRRADVSSVIRAASAGQDDGDDRPSRSRAGARDGEVRGAASQLGDGLRRTLGAARGDGNGDRVVSGLPRSAQRGIAGTDSSDPTSSDTDLDAITDTTGTPTRNSGFAGRGRGTDAWTASLRDAVDRTTRTGLGAAATVTEQDLKGADNGYGDEASGGSGDDDLSALASPMRVSRVVPNAADDSDGRSATRSRVERSALDGLGERAERSRDGSRATTRGVVSRIRGMSDAWSGAAAGAVKRASGSDEGDPESGSGRSGWGSARSVQRAVLSELPASIGVADDGEESRSTRSTRSASSTVHSSADSALNGAGDLIARALGVTPTDDQGGDEGTQFGDLVAGTDATGTERRGSAPWAGSSSDREVRMGAGGGGSSSSALEATETVMRAVSAMLGGRMSGDSSPLGSGRSNGELSDRGPPGGGVFSDKRRGSTSLDVSDIGDQARQLARTITRAATRAGQDADGLDRSDGRFAAAIQNAITGKVSPARSAPGESGREGSDLGRVTLMRAYGSASSARGGDAAAQRRALSSQTRPGGRVGPDGSIISPTVDGQTMTVTPPELVGSGASTIAQGAQQRHLINIDEAGAPSTYEFEVDVPEGNTLEENAQGGVDIRDAQGNLNGRLETPWAYDASGKKLDTSFAVDEDSRTVTQNVDHTDAIYPVVADPAAAQAVPAGPPPPAGEVPFTPDTGGQGPRGGLPPTGPSDAPVADPGAVLMEPLPPAPVVPGPKPVPERAPQLNPPGGTAAAAVVGDQTPATPVVPAPEPTAELNPPGGTAAAAVVDDAPGPTVVADNTPERTVQPTTELDPPGGTAAAAVVDSSRSTGSGSGGDATDRAGDRAIPDSDGPADPRTGPIVEDPASVLKDGAALEAEPGNGNGHPALDPPAGTAAAALTSDSEDGTKSAGGSSDGAGPDAGADNMPLVRDPADVLVADGPDARRDVGSGAGTVLDPPEGTAAAGLVDDADLDAGGVQSGAEPIRSADGERADPGSSLVFDPTDVLDADHPVATEGSGRGRSPALDPPDGTAAAAVIDDNGTGDAETSDTAGLYLGPSSNEDRIPTPDEIRAQVREYEQRNAEDRRRWSEEIEAADFAIQRKIDGTSRPGDDEVIARGETAYDRLSFEPDDGAVEEVPLVREVAENTVGRPKKVLEGARQAGDVLWGLVGGDEAQPRGPPSPARVGNAPRVGDHQKTFEEAYGVSRTKVYVHHAIEKQALTKYPGLFSRQEIESAENLRGIPRGLNDTLHLSMIRMDWNDFYRDNPAPTRQDVLDFASQLDHEYGYLYLPQLDR